MYTHLKIKYGDMENPKNSKKIKEMQNKLLFCTFSLAFLRSISAVIN